MFERRVFLQAASGVALLGLAPGAYAKAGPLLTVYKSPTCGCCGEWVKHIRAGGLQGQPQRYATLAFDASGHHVFAQH